MCLLIIENPQSMHPSVLEELRCLAAVEVGRRTRAQSPAAGPALAESGARIAAHGGAWCRERAALFARPAERRSDRSVCCASTAGGRRRESGRADAVYADAADPCVQRRRACRINNLLCERARVGSVRGRTARDDLGARSGHRGARLAIQASCRRPLRCRDVAAPADAPAPRAKLVITHAGLPDREITLDGDRMLVGRGEEADMSHRLGLRQPLSRADRARRRPGPDARPRQHQRPGRQLAPHPAPRAAASRSDPGRTGAGDVSQRAAAATAQPDPGETICFARPGFPHAAGEEDAGALLAFGRLDTSG